MDPVVELEATELAADPGGQAQVRVTVRNRDTIVERYRLDVLGDAAGWAQVVPAELRVDVGQESSATVIFTPLAGPGGPAGLVPFGVRAVSAVDATSSATAEGQLRVGEVVQPAITMRPVNSAGRWSARHRVEVTNRGNSPTRLRLTPVDPDDKLGFLMLPEAVDVAPGGTAHGRLKVRTRDPALRGTPQRHGFRVTADRLGPDGTPVESTPPPHAPVVAGLPFDPTKPGVDGAFTQKPILSRVTVMAGVAALAGLAGLAFLLDRPAPAQQDGVILPEAPGDVAAAAAGADAVQLSWEPVARVDGYKVLSVLPDSGAAFQSQEVDAQQTAFQAAGLEPGKEHCFKVVSIRSEVDSEPSDEVCATTLAAPEEGQDGEGGAEDGQGGEEEEAGGGAGGEDGQGGEEEEAGGGAGGQSEEGDEGGGDGTTSTTTEQGGTGADGPARGDWIAALAFSPSVQLDAEAIAQRQAETLRDAGHEAQVLDTRDYPDMTPKPATPGYLTYVGGFDDEASARRYCIERSTVEGRPRPCGAYQPQPERADTD